MIFEVINPCDPVTFEAPDLESAAVAVILLGRGQLGAQCVDDKDIEVPLLFLGGAEEWAMKQFGTSLATLVSLHTKAAIPVLRSFVTGSVGTRKLYKAAMKHIPSEKGRAEFRREWDDDKRSSLTEITNVAHRLADQLEGADG